MNLSEFKAWFEGFTEAMDGPPGPKAWKRIQERVKEIRAEPTPFPQIIREYVPRYPYWPYWSGGLQVSNTSMNILNDNHDSVCNSLSQQMAAMTAQSTDDAFRLIGRSDAEAIQ